jgi:hypothetical protein
MVDLDLRLGQQVLDFAVRQPSRRYQRTAITINSNGTETRQTPTAAAYPGRTGRRHHRRA